MKPEKNGAPVLSVVLPVFNEEVVLAELYQRLTTVLDTLREPYELLFVNDCSTDRSTLLLKQFAVQDPRVGVLTFSRNFGHQIAITAGLDYCAGQAVIIMDADLQDPPEVLPLLVAKWREGYDVVYAVRMERQGEGIFKRRTATLFSRTLRWLE